LIIGSARALLGRLEQQLHRTRQAIAHPREDGGHAELNRHVVVVAAGVHHADFLAVPLRLDRRLERQLGLFADREPIHVRAQRDHGPGLRALEDRNDARAGDGRHVVTETLQLGGDHLRRPHLLVPELGMLVEVPPPRHHLRIDLRHQAIDVRC
jgi:hypothetical protein